MTIVFDAIQDLWAIDVDVERLTQAFYAMHEIFIKQFRNKK